MLLIVLGAAIPAAAISVQLTPSADAPSAVGSLVTFTADGSDMGDGNVWYRFRVKSPSGTYRVLRDYGPSNTIDWATSLREGDYEIEVSARNVDTGEEASSATPYLVVARTSDANPVIAPTPNPLVFLYSAPPCAVGSRMRVEMRSPDGTLTTTPYSQCRDGVSMNFYLSGMLTGTTYSVSHLIDTGSQFIPGPQIPIDIPALPVDVAPHTVVTPAPAGETGLLLHGTLSQNTVATDLAGNPVWYYPGYLSTFTAPAGGGLFLGIVQDPYGDPSRQTLVEFDLAGVTVRETNAARVNEQLRAMGKRSITSFHHDARSLPGGKILTLASVEQILTDVQGPGDVDVIGDMILVLDADLQVIWTWDAFDHLDTHRMAVLGETCKLGAGGCPPFFAADTANDWLHSNSVQLTPDGNLLLSVRHQDWVIKIDYSNGNGSGEVLWKLGKDGDFTLASTDPYPWFSHQHDAGFLPGDNTTLTLVDNGNTRHTLDPNAHSRGQVLQIDETNRTANLVLNADLGAYSIALGSAQLLANGNYHFEVGWIPGVPGQPNTSRSVEVDPTGKIVYAMEAATETYRSYRMTDLYSK